MELTMTWLDAWTNWWAGNPIPDGTQIWGITIRWWNRGGQLAQLAGAFMVVLDIIGPEKLRRQVATLRAFKFYQFIHAGAARAGIALLAIWLSSFFLLVLVSQNENLLGWFVGAWLALFVPVLLCGIVAMIDRIVSVFEVPLTVVLVRVTSWSLILCGSTFVLLAS